MTAQLQEFTVEARDIGTDGSLMIVTGEYDDAFLTGRVDEHYEPLEGIPYLIEETTKDIEQIMWWKLQNPPQLDENGNDLPPPTRANGGKNATARALTGSQRVSRMTFTRVSCGSRRTTPGVSLRVAASAPSPR